MANSVVVDYQAKTGQFITDIQRAAREHKKAMKEMAESAMEFAKVAGIAYSIEQIVEFADRMANFGHEMAEMGQKVGMTAGDLSALKTVSDQVGLSMEDLQTGVNKFSKSAVAAAGGAKAQAAEFKALGVNINDASGHLKPTAVLLDEVAGKFSKFKDGNIKTADAMAIFGKAGANLIPFLNRLGSEGFNKATEDAKAFGIYLGGDAVKASEDYHRESVKLHEIIDGLGMLFVNVITPALTAIIGQFTDFSTKTTTADGRVATLSEGLLTITQGFITLSSWIQKTTAWLAGFADQLAHIGDLIASTPFDRIANDVASMGANPMDAVSDMQKAMKEQKSSLKQFSVDVAKTWKDIDSSFTSIDSDTAKRITALWTPPKVAANDDNGGTVTPPILAHGGGGKSAKKDPSIAALQSFADYVNGLTAKTWDTGDKALDEYAKGIEDLNKHMDEFIRKGGGAKDAATLFAKGQAADLAKLSNAEDDAARKRKAELDDYNQGLRDQLADVTTANNLQAQAVGMGAKEAQQAQQLNAIRVNGERQLLALQKQIDLANAKGAKDEAALLKAKYDNYKQYIEDMVAETQHGYSKMAAAQSSWVNGAKAALQDYADRAKDVAGQVSGVMGNAFQGMEDSLVNFVTTGKLNFKSLVASILSDLARMEIRVLESKILQSLFNSFMGDPSANLAEATAAQMPLPNANGNAFSGGNVIPFALGGIVSSPMTFPMASGRTGLMGEAGPEAIVPLARGSDGKLGIRSSGGGSNVTTSVTVVINQDGSANGKTQSDNATGKAAGDAIQSITTKTVIDMLRPGGILYRAA